MYLREIPSVPDQDSQATLLASIDGVPVAVDTQPVTEDTINVLQHYMDLRDSLTHLAGVDANAYNPQLYSQVPEAGQHRASEQAQESEHEKAYAYFARAFGANALLAAGFTERQVHAQAWNGFTDFKKTFGSPAHATEREEYRKWLSDTVAQIASQEQPDDEGLAPSHRKPEDTDYPKTLGEGDETEDTPDTRKKLEIISNREGLTGFLPTTHREKNTTMYLIHHIETRKAAGGKQFDGVNDYLTSIYEHQIGAVHRKYSKQKELIAADNKEQRKLAAQTNSSYQPRIWEGPNPTAIAVEAQEVAVDTVRSVINEIDDSRENALYSLNALIDLGILAGENGSPNTKLADLLAEGEGKGIDPQPFLRYLDLKFFRDTGELPLFDPLRTREIRPAPPEYTTKNKIVVDPYLHVPDIEEHRAEFDAMLAAIPVKTVRELIVEATRDAQNRHLFFTRTLQGITGTYAGFARQVSRAGKAAA